MRKHVLPTLAILIIFLLSTYTGAALTNITMLDDDFESDFSLWTDNGATDWTLATDQYVSATHSAHCGSTNNDLFSDNIDMSDATMINVTFSYRINAIDANDNINLYYYDGTDYDLIDEIGDDAEGTWLTFSQVTTDSQYFDNGFHIYFDGSSIDRNENLWIDDALIIKEHDSNDAPTIENITILPTTIKGGNTITIYANTTNHLVNDTEQGTLYLYCDSTSTPTAANTDCTGGTTSDSAHPYILTCTFTTPTDDTTHREYCRIYDGSAYSSDVNETYTTDSTAPSTSITSVAGDTLPSYFDTNDDSATEINITGEASMSCRWSNSDIVYGSMSSGNECTIDGTTGSCSVDDVLSQGSHTYYISCRDSLENEQTTSQNLDVSFYLDYTAPTTSDNGASIVQVPTYTITITEADNVDGDPITKYCTDTTNTCTPSTIIDSGGTVTFTSSNRGVNYLRYNSTDDAGNNQAVQSQTVNINQFPILTSATDNATTIPGGAIVNVSVIASDPDAGQEITMFVCNSTSATSSGCTDGHYCNITTTENLNCTFTAESDSSTHNWYAFIYDELDRVATASPLSGSYTTDVTAPTITIIDPDNTTYTQTSVTATISLNEAGSWAGYSLNGTVNISLTNTSLTIWTIDIENLPDTTTHNITFYANDSYGNMASSSTLWFTIDTTSGDTTPPLITTWSPTNNSNHTSSTVLFNITLNENGNWSGYSLDSAANVSLGNLTTLKVWNKSATVSDGGHTVIFYSNDSSSNANMGSSSTLYFTVDTTIPTPLQYSSTPSSANDTVNITCYAQWTDNILLDYGYVEHNETGTAINSSQISLGNWTNSTIYHGNTTPSTVYCKFYAFDSLGNVNTTTTTFTISDVTAPTIDNITYVPNTTALMDPDTQINITVNTSDTYSFDSVILQYKNNSASTWINSTMTQLGSSTGYNTTFTPDTNNTWSFRIIANDSTGNQNITGITNISIQLDKNWTNSTTIPDTKSITITDTQVFSAGDLTFTNTGDHWLNFTITSNASWITFNGSTDTSLSFNLSNSSETTTFNVTANTTGYSAGTELPYRITISTITTNTTSEDASPPTQTIDKTVRILNTNGPYLTVSIDTYDPSVDTSQTEVSLIATVNNYGTQDATGSWLKWTLPAGWTITEGELNRSIGNLPIGGSATNTLKVTIGTTEENTNITATANCTEEIGSSDTKNITVGSPAVVTTPGTTTPGGGGGSIPTPSINIFATHDVVRGESVTFNIPVKNIKNSTLQDVTLSIDGFKSQYITIEPSELNGIGYKETKYFSVTISAPAYMEKGEHTLTLNIVGDSVQGIAHETHKQTLYVKLRVREVGQETIETAIEQSENIIKEFENENITSTRASSLSEQIQQAYENEDYELANKLSEELENLKEAAFTSKDLIEKISNNVWASDASGIPVSDTRKLLGMAKAAFEREDFETALARLEEAEIVYALETRGKLNYIKLMFDYWYLTLLGFIFSGFASIVGYRKYKLYTLSRAIKDLNLLEEKILNSIKEVQIKMFIKKKIGPSEYRLAIDSFNKKLSEIRTNKIKLRSKRRRILKVSHELDELKEEHTRIIDMIKSLQRSYFNKGSIGTRTYNQRYEQYSINKIEIEEQVALAEAKLAKNLMFEEMGFGVLNKVKRLFGKKIPNDKKQLKNNIKTGINNKTKKKEEKLINDIKQDIRKQHEEIKKQINDKTIKNESKQIFEKKSSILNSIKSKIIPLKTTKIEFMKTFKTITAKNIHKEKNRTELNKNISTKNILDDLHFPEIKKSVLPKINIPLPDFDKYKRQVIGNMNFKLRTIKRHRHNRLTKKIPTKGRIKHHLRKLKGRIKNKIIGW